MLIKINNQETKLIYEVLTGSRVYGLNTETSDYDWRGVVIPEKEVLLSPFRNFEQYEEKENDRVLFSLEKFIKLTSNQNPNILELLFIDEDKIKHITKEGEILRENRNLFLTAKVKFTYSGYAFAQLKRIKNHKRWFDNPIQKPNKEDFGISGEPKFFKMSDINSLNVDFRNNLIVLLMKEFAEKLNINEDKKDLFDDIIRNAFTESSRIFFNKFFNEYLLHISRDIIKEEVREQIKNEYNYFLKLKEYKNYEQWKKNRNPERAKLEEKYGFDIKHGTHLLRLLHNAKEILTKGTLTPYVGDVDYIVRCKRGEMSYDELLEIAERLNKEIDDIYKNNQYVVPKKIDISRIERLYFDILNLK